MPLANAVKAGLVIFASALPLVGSAQDSQPPPALTVHAIKEGSLYWVEGGGGNSGVIIGKTGVIVVDAKINAAAGKQLIAEVAKLTPLPITHVILTHSDGDHVNGLVAFPDNVKIVAHAKNKAEQLAVYQFAVVEVGGGKCLPPADRLPNQIVLRPKVKIAIDGVPLVIHYFGPAHTSGDLVVEVPQEKVAFTGDLITSSVLVHPEKGGSFAGWFANAKGILDLDADKLVGGHAKEVDTKASLRERVAAYQKLRDKVDGLVDAGTSLAEVKKAMGDPATDPSGCRGIPYPSLGQVEFYEHTDRKQELK
jgi:glyoxylase-like metal-dependent hydrolase (beta-lactamase superfamily II)